MPARRLCHDTIRKLAEEGLTYREIAHRLNTSHAVISDIMRRKFGIHRGKCGVPPRYQFDIESIRHLTEQGWSTSRIAAEYGCGAEQVRRTMKKHGIARHNQGAQFGDNNHAWHGGRIVDKTGYTLVYCPEHPYANSGGYVREHRLVMECYLGRLLHRYEVVHHRNGDRSDNSLDNLELFETNALHLKHELTGNCPEWTPEGQQRILEACRKGSASHQGSETDAVQ